MFALASLLLAPTLLGADPAGDSPAAVVDATTAPAVQVSFPTEDGRLYQIQRRDGDGWENVDTALRGTGEPVTRLLPAGEYRVVRPDGWALVWRDEFDGDQLDLTKWGKEENNLGGGNNERQAYRVEDKYAFVRDGKLHLAVHRDPHTTSDGKTQPYSSARLRTRGRAEWTFGRFEVRAKMPDGQGIWPAVWMLPTDSPYGGWAAGGEIDILESRGSAVEETTGALHFGGAWPRNEYVAHAYEFPNENAAEAFHTYAVEWSADAIRWFVDGELVQTRTKDEWFSEAARDNPSAPFDSPFHLLINVAVDGRFFEHVDQQADRLPADAFPQTLLVDYVRVYQKE
ncbi:family 16 glycosylhydrolase [Alienimonas sp. DA493]|uniref:glycoside hydrolase family 16 protein n=1 Tax=Alienimonas sp. DA493 TaxID=3373605 RepID=UPI003754EB07